MEKLYNIGALEDFLIEYGLSGKQAKVYLSALKLGASNVQTIAKDAKIQRTNAYDAVETLIAKGLLAVSTVGKKKMFIAESPSILEKFFAEKQEALKKVIPQLESLHATTEHKPRILYYPGLEGYRTVYEDTLTCTEGKLFGIFSVQDIWEVLGRPYVDRIVERRVKKGIRLRVIRSPERDIPHVYPSREKDLREFRHSPPGMIFPLTTYVYDNKVIYLSSKKETFGLIIESADIAQGHRNYFEALWQISMPA
ncbi:MAG: helix-turn-helix domain-containing protein [Patescibacteria group bacterium]